MREDPMCYRFDIREHETGEVRQGFMAAWWSDEHSQAGLHAMCDCQIGAFFSAARTITGKPLDAWTVNWFSPAQASYLIRNQCDHRPSRRYEALRAVLPDGRVVDFA